MACWLLLIVTLPRIQAWFKDETSWWAVFSMYGIEDRIRTMNCKEFFWVCFEMASPLLSYGTTASYATWQIEMKMIEAKYSL